MGEQMTIGLQGRRKKQLPAATIHDLNDKKISELTADEYDAVKEEWDIHFNDLDHRDGKFKVSPKGGIAERFHDKADAIKRFYGLDVGATLFEKNKVLMTRDK